MAIRAQYEQREFKVPEEALHPAVCCDVVDLGMEQTPWGAKHKVKVIWQLEALHPDTGKRFTQGQKYTLSLHEKAILRQHLEAWRGKRFTKAELIEGFDLEKLLGANCQLQTVHNITEGGGIYSNVQAIVPLGKGMTKMRVDGYTRVKDREGSGRGTSEAAGSDDVPF